MHLGVDAERFPQDLSTPRVIDMSSQSLVRDSGKCILCRRCVSVCEAIQTVGTIGVQERGSDSVVAPAFVGLGDAVCVNCGQCAAVCPVNAIYERDHIHPVEQAIINPDRHVVVQTAPAIRAAIGETMGMPPGSLVTGKLVTALQDDGLRRRLRHQLERRPDHPRGRHGAAGPPAPRAGGQGSRRRPADDDQLLAGLGEVPRALLPGPDAQPLDGQVAAADARHGHQDLLRAEPRPAAGGHRRGRGDAVHGEEVRGRPARDDRQRRARRGLRPHHPRARPHDPQERLRLRQPTGQLVRRPARRFLRRRRHLRQQRRRDRGRAAHGLRGGDRPRRCRSRTCTSRT